MITAGAITDEQVRAATDDEDLLHAAFVDEMQWKGFARLAARDMRHSARARCAEILNARERAIEALKERV